MGFKRSLRKRWTKTVSNPIARRKLVRGLQRFAQLPSEELRDIDTIVEIIRGIGLRYDDRDVYGAESAYMNHTINGLWQIPQQLAKAMVVLSRQNIDTFLEVGTHTGYTSSVLTAYLHRFNPRLQAVTIDPQDFFIHYPSIRSMIPLEYRSCTSEDFRGSSFDCVLIDGDHAYDSVRTDFENVGRQARICMFHDINDDLVGFENVPKFWEELVASNSFRETHEILECPSNMRTMGIGIGIRDA